MIREKTERNVVLTGTSERTIIENELTAFRRCLLKEEKSPATLKSLQEIETVSKADASMRQMR